MFNFLTTLPAILGIIGFVIYLILKKSITEDPIIKSILEKLRYNEPGFYNQLDKLSDSEKVKILKTDYRLRDKISEGDRKLLDKSLTNQYRTNLFVYSLCAILLLVGIYLFTRPVPLQIDNIQVQNTDSRDNNQIVDLDPITVTWTSSGKNGDILVALENIETGKQTKRYRALASDGEIIFKSDNYDNYDKILSNRFPNESNKIRAIVYSGQESFKSKPFEIKVGVKIICLPEESDKLVFNAIIDQRIIDNFHFAPRLTLFKDEHFNNKETFEAPEFSSRPTLVIRNTKDFTISNFALSVNPRDIVNTKVYRTDVESLKVAFMELKNKQNK
ncbi:hypothetical protein AHMF7605_20915 [Adhaeribacter arboris]|uniref:Uncharacterized protein n=1 Tax=Adhaeribacter arboris TaxID=2072846 RepID=A0A2T2YJT6_9BACT|nr:hypothetical protein [Adhaeribacter arboris]PSR55783.1 hypothetical protein AHMF7605_20915 [Adhaeribacter arboris]